MAIDTLYVPLFNIEEVILDKDTGLPLSGGVVRFWRDEQRTQPKEVFQISGSSPNYTFVNVGAVFTLGISGTFVDGSGDPFVPYAYPYDAEGNEDRYYVTVESAGAVAQFVREAVPYLADGGVPPEERSNTNNELVNPQFVSVLFDTASSSHTYSVTGSNTVTPVAPGWDLITSGTGTVEVEWLATSGAAVDTTNPPYALRLNAAAALGGSVILRQRLSNSPRLLAGNYGSATFTAAVISGGDTAIALRYVPSTGTTVDIIPATAIPTDTAFHTISNNAALPTDNTDSSATGYVDIQLEIPTARNIKITSIQLVGINYPANIPFDEQSVAMQINGLFDYYKPKLEYKPIPSYLVGWDFPLNPAQFNGGRTQAATAIGANKSKYVWDQTIVFQSADSGVGVTGGSAGELVLTAAAATQAAIVQYLPATLARKILNDRIAVNVQAKASSAVNATISLWYTTDASLPNVATGTNNSLVATLGTNGKPATFNGNWTEVPRDNLGDALFQIATNGTTNFNDYGFSGWDLKGAAGANTATFFAIVIGTAAITMSETVSIYNVGLCNGDIPTRPAPQAPEEVLSDCQYYFETTFPQGTVPAASTAGAIYAPMNPYYNAGAANVECAANGFGWKYQTQKRTNPTLNIYSGSSTTADRITAFLNGSSATASLEVTLSTFFTAFPGAANAAGFAYRGTTLSSMITPIASTTAGSAGILYHYIADARLGIV